MRLEYYTTLTKYIRLYGYYTSVKSMWWYVNDTTSNNIYRDLNSIRLLLSLYCDMDIIYHLINVMIRKWYDLHSDPDIIQFRIIYKR